MKTKEERAMLISVKEAARVLSVSGRFLRQLVRQNRVAFYKLSERTTRFDLDELRRYMRLIAEGTQKRRKK